MLKIRMEDDTKEIEESDVIRDVDEAFLKVHLTGTEKEKAAIRLVEQGTYHDQNSYIDRFGYKLHIEEMSTGCKAILVVLNNRNKWVDTKECGLNALSALISVCDEGRIILRDTEYKLPTYGLADSIEVEVNGLRFTSFSELNEYMDNI